jgi:hypothetical protein
MTFGDDVAQSLGPTKTKWGRPGPPPWPVGQVLVPFQFLLSRRFDARGIRWPKSVEAELGG